MLQYYAATQQLPLFLFGFFIIVGLIVGRAACGWLCPFGLLQDIMYKLKTRKFGIPQHLNYGKYVILIVLVIILPLITHIHWFSRLCPLGALTAGIPWVAWNPIDPDFNAPVVDLETIGLMYYLKITILIFFLVWFVMAQRPFCRVICPMGAIWAIFNRVSLLKFKVEQSCLNCEQCEVNCPMELPTPEKVDSENCIKCFDCNSCKHISAKFNLR
jgi:polyferredoxin